MKVEENETSLKEIGSGVENRIQQKSIGFVRGGGRLHDNCD